MVPSSFRLPETITVSLADVRLSGDGAAPPQAGDYGCTLEHVVATDGVTPVPGVSCTVAIVP